MRTTNRNLHRVKAATRKGEDLLNSVGGTITGGPMPPLDLLGILSLGGAVFGAAHAMDNKKEANGTGAGGEQGIGIALSDGSTISFASIDGAVANADRIAGFSGRSDPDQGAFPAKT